MRRNNASLDPDYGAVTRAEGEFENPNHTHHQEYHLSVLKSRKEEKINFFTDLFIDLIDSPLNIDSHRFTIDYARFRGEREALTVDEVFDMVGS